MRWRRETIRILRGNSLRAKARSPSLRSGSRDGRRRPPLHKLIQSRLFFQVDVLNILDGQAQESLSEAAKLFGGVGGEELKARCGTALFHGRIRIRQEF